MRSVATFEDLLLFDLRAGDMDAFWLTGNQFKAAWPVEAHTFGCAMADAYIEAHNTIQRETQCTTESP
jgi:hypothetical protein